MCVAPVFAGDFCMSIRGLKRTRKEFPVPRDAGEYAKVAARNLSLIYCL